MACHGQHFPIQLPPERPVSDADRQLRRTNKELVVHTACGQIRGPVRELFPECTCKSDRETWQSCRCEDEPVRWAACDVSRKTDLCIVCARGTAGGTSRWAWLACAFCRKVNTRLRDAGCGVLAVGRHSLLNGVSITGDLNPKETAAAIGTMMKMSGSWDALFKWFPGEVARLAQSQGWSHSADIPFRTWREQLPPSYEHSVDAVSRLIGADVRPVVGD